MPNLWWTAIELPLCKKNDQPPLKKNPSYATVIKYNFSVFESRSQICLCKIYLYWHFD